MLLRTVIILFLFPHLVAAQVKEQTAWLASFNSIKFNTHWGMHLDMQFRSGDDREYVRNLLVRPGLTYHFNKNNNATLGYLLNDTYNRLPGNTQSKLTEHRVWQQFLHSQRISSRISLAHRFRLEQRFIERATEHVFAQRFRYFLRAVIPIARRDSSFRQGIFIALQDEIFLNVQNKEKLNANFYDQNRAYAALGYRLSPKVDIEAGYMSQLVKGRAINTTNHVMQLALYSRF